MRSENLSGIEAPTLGRSCSKVTVLPTATRIREVLHNIVNWLRRLYFIHVWHMEIGKGSIISFGATLDKTYPQGVHIGENSVLVFGAAVLTHDWANGRVSNVRIGDNCFIGPKAIVLPGVTIGDNCVVGPSSVVARDVPEGSVVAGNPARIMGKNPRTVSDDFPVTSVTDILNQYGGNKMQRRYSGTARALDDRHNHKIWIDLDNSPHVPFFEPIIDELRKLGYKVLLTARDNAQVVELLDNYDLKCKLYGKHYGKHKAIKVLGIGLRVLQLAPLILKERPDFAVSHGSRTQIILSSLLGIPCLAMTDYEHASSAGFRPRWLMMPEVVPDSGKVAKHQRLSYPGIKEDVYVPRFRPVPGIRAQLGLSDEDLVVTIRPPATEAHYHNPASDELFRCVVEFLAQQPDVRMVLLPRYKSQAASLQCVWPDLFRSGKVLVPEHAVDGLNLIWFSDLVISGGGTMNREAAALGVPVYSIFRGKQAAVDRYLSECGRLILLESPDDVKTIRLVRRKPSLNATFGGAGVLGRVVEAITSKVELVSHSN